MEIKCGRDYQNCNTDQKDEIIDSFSQHLKTCKDFNDIINAMANKASFETIIKILNGYE